MGGEKDGRSSQTLRLPATRNLSGNRGSDVAGEKKFEAVDPQHVDDRRVGRLEVFRVAGGLRIVQEAPPQEK